MELFECQSLESLTISFNNLTKLLAPTHRAAALVLVRGLERLPVSFGNLTNLQHIHLLIRVQEFAEAAQCKDNGIFGILVVIRSCEFEDHTVKHWCLVGIRSCECEEHTVKTLVSLEHLHTYLYKW